MVLVDLRTLGVVVVNICIIHAIIIWVIWVCLIVYCYNRHFHEYHYAKTAAITQISIIWGVISQREILLNNIVLWIIVIKTEISMNVIIMKQLW
jgi:hypothetical protein